MNDLRHVQRVAADAIQAVIDAAIAHRDQQWHNALAEVDRPLLNINPVLPYVPRNPDEVPELLRRLEAMMKVNP